MNRWTHQARSLLLVLLRHVDDLRECSCISNSEVSEHLAVDLDTGFRQTRNEAAVRNAIGAGQRR